MEQTKDKEQLIQQDWIHCINTLHPLAPQYADEGADTPTLAQVLKNQIAQAENDVIHAIAVLLEKYDHVQNLAYSTRPNVAVTSLLMAAGIETSNTGEDEHY